MKWVRNPFAGKRDEENDAGEDTQQAPANPVSVDSKLVLMVHDALGPGAYRLHFFRTSEEAAEYIEFWFPKGVEHGIKAFWACHSQPPADDASNSEVIVLVRDDHDPDIAFVFSCEDLEQARSWISHEVERGLAPENVLCFWAERAAIWLDHWNRVRFTPSGPPDGAIEEPAWVSQTVSISRVFEPANSDSAAATARAEEPHFQGFGSPPGRF